MRADPSKEQHFFVGTRHENSIISENPHSANISNNKYVHLEIFANDSVLIDNRSPKLSIQMASVVRNKCNMNQTVEIRKTAQAPHITNTSLTKAFPYTTIITS
jgi:hypothetical protein